MNTFDIILWCAVGLAWRLSKRPKKEAVLACFVCLSMIAGYNLYEPLTGVAPYWLQLLTELTFAVMLFSYCTKMKKFHDKMYYLALSTFLLTSSFITGFYIIDLGPYESYALYAGTSRALGITHVLFMLVFSDGIINSGIFSKMLGWFDNVTVWGRSNI